jgi:hypothetical protein
LSLTRSTAAIPTWGTMQTTTLCPQKCQRCPGFGMRSASPSDHGRVVKKKSALLWFIPSTGTIGALQLACKLASSLLKSSSHFPPQLSACAANAAQYLIHHAFGKGQGTANFFVGVCPVVSRHCRKARGGFNVKKVHSHYFFADHTVIIST